MNPATALGDSQFLAAVTKAFAKPTVEAVKFLLQSGIIDHTEARAVAEKVYDGCFNTNTICWNDRFYVAQNFRLDDKRKKDSSYGILRNGMAGYFQLITSQGFELLEYLKKQEALPKVRGFIEDHSGNWFLSEPNILDLAGFCDLTEKDLAQCAYQVCTWAANRYNRTATENMAHFYTEPIAAGTPPSISTLESLAKTYIDPIRRNEILTRLSSLSRKSAYNISVSGKNKL